MSINYTKASKYMSYLLRHHPEEGNLFMDDVGWVRVEDLAAAIAKKDDFREFAKSDVYFIAATDQRLRYACDEDGTHIRATHGHSVDVTAELKVVNRPCAILYHGTSEKSVDSIAREGIKPMGRKFVHLTDSYGDAFATAMRHGNPYVVLVNARDMADDGMRFYVSISGVYLTKFVPAKYIQCAANLKPLNGEE